MDNVTLNLFVETYLHLLGKRNPEVERHSRRVAMLTVELAKACRISKRNRIHIWRGAMLHDIGKICIPDEILQKEAPLTKEEYAIIREHPITAYNILRQVPYFRPALDIPYYHHEKWDGTGYPLGLKGKKIPLVARISAVVDVWDALLSDRPYRPAWKPEDAKMYLLEQAGSHFDPQVVRVFVGVDEAPLPFNPERKLYNGQIPENILWHEGGNLSTAMDGRITN